jgi:hypothetical protein
VDPTLAALLGAGIGALVTAISPWLTGRMQHKLRRREVMREAYLEGMRSVSMFDESASTFSEADVNDVRRRVFEANLNIGLMGTRRTADRFGKVNDMIVEQGQRITRVLNLQARAVQATELAEAIESREDLAHRNRLVRAYDDFVDAARRDMAVEDHWFVRLRRLVKRRL